MKTLAALLCLVLLADARACEIPSLVEVPSADGLSWNKYETLIPALQAYFGEMQAYVDCLADEIEKAQAGRKDRIGFASLLVARNNAAVEESQQVMALYQALRADLEALEQAAPTAE